MNEAYQKYVNPTVRCRVSNYIESWQLLVISPKGIAEGIPVETRFKAEGRGQKAEGRGRKK